MKVWIKMLIATVLGMTVGPLLLDLAIGIFNFFNVTLSSGLAAPIKDGSSGLLTFLSNLIVSMGRYALFPFVFFSLGMAVHDLRREKLLGRTLLRSFFYMAVITFILVVVGSMIVLLLSPQRIPMNPSKTDLVPPNWSGVFDSIVPKNALQILTGGVDFLLPLYIFAFVIGLNFNFDKEATQPTVNLFDSLSRIFYHLNSFFVELFSFGIFFLSGAWIMQMSRIQGFQLYLQLFFVLLIASAVVIFVVFPGILYFLNRKENPYRWIFGLLGSGLTGFFSGDSFFSLGVNTRFTRENLGVPRKIGAVNLPLFAMFGRGGTAMVTAITFFVILKSYSSLEITWEQIVWTVSFSFLFSFALPAVPIPGVNVSLALLSGLYGKGYEGGFTTLQPMIPILISFATLIDVIAAGLTSMLVAQHEKVQKQIKTKFFI